MTKLSDNIFQSKVSPLLDSLTKVIGLVAGVALTGSLVYDWGYFHAIGLSFSDIPTTISDHMRSALNWIPNAIFYSFIIVVLELFLKAVERGMTEEELIRTSSHPKFIAWFRKSPTTFIEIIAVIIFVSYILLGSSFSSGLGLSLIIFWGMFIFWVNRHTQIFEKRSSELWFVIKWLPPVLIFIAFMGYSAGAVSWSPDVKPIRFTLYLKNVSDPVQLRAVRLFEKGVLFKSTPDLPVVFVRWEDIIKIEKSTAKPWQGVLKEWFDFPKEKETAIKEEGTGSHREKEQTISDKK